VLGICLGGDAIGAFDRREASRERLLERPRTRAFRAPKKARDVGDVGDAVDVGDIWSEDCEVCEPTVLVRMGGIAWKLGLEVMIGKGRSSMSMFYSNLNMFATEVSIPDESKADGNRPFKYPSPDGSRRTPWHAAQFHITLSRRRITHMLPPFVSSPIPPTPLVLARLRPESRCR
jgi:hypothetical protein